MKKILLVENDENITYACSLVLSGAGFEVLTASNGDNAMEIIDKTGDLSLILTDTVMPSKLQGFDVLRIADVKGIPALIMSGNLLINLKADQRELAKGRYLEKPIRTDDLLSKIKEMLQPPQP